MRPRLRVPNPRRPPPILARAAQNEPAHGLDSFAGSFIRLIEELQERCWLEKQLASGCGARFSDVDVDPSEVLDERLGRPDLWLLRASRPTWDWDLVFGRVEVFDLVALPRTRQFHQSAYCRWHWSELVVEPARRIYRWRANRLLERVRQEVRLADEGDDEGRIVAVTDEPRADLLHLAVTRTGPGSGDQVREAIAMFRPRVPPGKRGGLAVVALAGVLEQRRGLLKDHLHGKDEGALFEIANGFGLANSGTASSPVIEGLRQCSAVAVKYGSATGALNRSRLRDPWLGKGEQAVQRRCEVGPCRFGSRLMGLAKTSQ